MLERECWWSPWIIFVLFKFFWTERVYAIINSAKIRMIFYMPLLQGWYLYGLYSKDWILYVEIEDFRAKGPDWRSSTYTCCCLIYFDTFSPLSPEKAWFISQIVRIAHKIRNCLFIIYVFCFTTWLSFELIDYVIFGSILKPHKAATNDLSLPCLLGFMPSNLPLVIPQTLPFLKFRCMAPTYLIHPSYHCLLHPPPELWSSPPVVPLWALMHLPSSNYTLPRQALPLSWPDPRLVQVIHICSHFSRLLFKISFYFSLWDFFQPFF